MAAPREEARSLPDGYAALDELAAPPPVDGADERRPTGRRKRQRQQQPAGGEPATTLATRLCTLSHLVLFSILGTLARLGLQALTSYPGAPVQTGVTWANFGGSLIMGFLAEDRALFREEDDEEEEGEKKEKTTVPLYVGLATGFCGSFTSFSSFMRDAFLALSNDLPLAGGGPRPPPRSPGYSVLALLGTLVLTPALALSALAAGAQLAPLLAPVVPSLRAPRRRRRAVDRLVAVLGPGAWLAAVVLAAAADRAGRGAWRGDALFALALAPAGCLVRFYAALALNARRPAFPLGTFAVNAAGTLLEAALFVLQHAPPRSGAGAAAAAGPTTACQLLQGAMDGFCGCATTVSTWALELARLRGRRACVYGAATLAAGLVAVVAVMGGLRWTVGFASTACGG